MTPYCTYFNAVVLFPMLFCQISAVTIRGMDDFERMWMVSNNKNLALAPLKDIQSIGGPSLLLLYSHLSLIRELPMTMCLTETSAFVSMWKQSFGFIFLYPGYGSMVRSIFERQIKIFTVFTI